NNVVGERLPVGGDTQRIDNGLLQRIEFNFHDGLTLCGGAVTGE
ncbi:MAG: hypothetical protein RLZ67_1268, partial [Actinomycetota bacterium]